MLDGSSGSGERDSGVLLESMVWMNNFESHIYWNHSSYQNSFCNYLHFIYLKWIIKFPKFSELIAVFHEESILGINIPVSWDVLLIESCDEPGVLVHKLCCFQSGNYFLHNIYLSLLALDYTQTYPCILHNFIFIMGTTFCKFCQPNLLTIPWGITESYYTDNTIHPLI